MRNALILFALLVVTLSVPAQVAYYCDFEDPNETSQWILNPHKSTLTEADFDQIWYIGTPGECGGRGQNGLYISADGGATPCYNSTRSSFIAAYRDLTLEAGTYTVRFDWRMDGKATDEIIVGWVPRTSKCNGSNSSPSAPSLLHSQKVSSVRGSKAWQQSSTSLTVPADQTQGRLVFYFYAAQGVVRNPAACIDNIEIMQGNCSAPTDVKCTTNSPDTATLSWTDSTATRYDIRYYNYQSDIWHHIDNRPGNTLTINLLEDGFTYFYVRSVCDSAAAVHSQWERTSAFGYIPGQRCIEYLDLGRGDSTAHAGQCYQAHFADYVNNPNNNGTGVEPADVNQSEYNSVTHVIHTDPSEIDPHTRDAGGLRTVPEGEIASVRLGGREYTSSGNNYSARVVYEYNVQPGISDLMILKYAIVMENPNHGDTDNPRMTLNILDSNGRQLGGCTQAEFRAGSGNTESWHTETFEGGTVLWCDWQTVTFSLRPYVGQSLTIRLTTTRCAYDTHYSYAYFTLGCRPGDFEGIACGDFSTDHFTAPEGFDYRWRKPGDPSKGVISSNQTFHIERTDTCTYLVEMVSKADPTCFFVLEANPNPLVPISDAWVTWVKQTGSTYNVTLSNDAHMDRINRLDTTIRYRTDEPVGKIHWDFGDGTSIDTYQKNIVHTYTSAGTYNIVSTVPSADGLCISEESTIELELTESSALRETSTVPTAEKIFHNGEILIIREGRKYDLMGRRKE